MLHLEVRRPAVLVPFTALLRGIKHVRVESRVEETLLVAMPTSTPASTTTTFSFAHVVLIRILDETIQQAIE